MNRFPYRGGNRFVGVVSNDEAPTWRGPSRRSAHLYLEHPEDRLAPAPPTHEQPTESPTTETVAKLRGLLTRYPTAKKEPNKAVEASYSAR